MISAEFHSKELGFLKVLRQRQSSVHITFCFWLDQLIYGVLSMSAIPSSENKAPPSKYEPVKGWALRLPCLRLLYFINEKN